MTKVFTNLQSLSRENQQEQLRDLAVRGDTITAAYIAQKLYGCSLAEASKIVERARRREQGHVTQLRVVMWL